MSIPTSMPSAWSLNMTSGQYQCDLNQYKILENVQKYPKVVFWIAAIIFAAVLIDRFIMPLIKKNEKLYAAVYRVPDTLIYLGAPAMLWFTAFTTFHMTEEIVRYYIEIPAMLIIFGTLAWKLYKNRHKLKVNLTEEEKKDNDPDKPNRNN